MYYFVALRMNNGTDEGICFSDINNAVHFRGDTIDRFAKKYGAKVEDLAKRVRLVISNSNYGFAICKTLEEGQSLAGLKKESELLMPYDHTNGGFRMGEKGDFTPYHPHDEEYEDLYVVVNDEDFVIGMFTTKGEAEDFKKQEEFYKNLSTCRIICKRSISEYIDFRKYTFLIDKMGEKAICFCKESEALAYLLHIHLKLTKEKLPSDSILKTGIFLLCELNSSYGLDVCYSMEDAYRDVDESKGDAGFKSIPRKALDEVFKENETLWNVCSQETDVSFCEFTSKNLAEEFGKQIDFWTHSKNYINPFISRTAIQKRWMEISDNFFDVILKYVKSASMDDFKKDFKEVWTEEEAELKYSQMRLVFPTMYLSLSHEEKLTFFRAAFKPEQ